MSGGGGRVPEGGCAGGRQVVREAIWAGLASKVYVLPGGGEPGRIAHEARQARIPVEVLPREGLVRLAGPHHQGVAARLRAVSALGVPEFLDRAFEAPDPVIVVLDHLEDPANVGAVARAAEALGAFGLIIPKRRSAGLGDASLRASAGALSHLAASETTNVQAALEAVKARGGWVVAADPEGETALSEVDFTGPVALVIGNEGRGVSRLVKERADIRARIPLGGHTASLNAGVAAGIFLYEIWRQRQARKGP